MRIIGRGAGPVRPPLTELTESELQELVALVGVASRGEEQRRQAAG
jgi:5-dehydro-4-deoxyglucarate dehydratase